MSNIQFSIFPVMYKLIQIKGKSSSQTQFWVLLCLCIDRVEELRCAVTLLMRVARCLKARRVSGGALELESVEVQVQLTETKSVEDLNPKDVRFIL